MPTDEILFIGCDGSRYWCDWRDWSELCQRDIHVRTIPGNPDCLTLTGDDYTFLWAIGISPD